MEVSESSATPVLADLLSSAADNHPQSNFQIDPPMSPEMEDIPYRSRCNTWPKLQYTAPSPAASGLSTVRTTGINGLDADVKEEAEEEDQAGAREGANEAGLASALESAGAKNPMGNVAWLRLSNKERSLSGGDARTSSSSSSPASSALSPLTGAPLPLVNEEDPMQQSMLADATGASPDLTTASASAASAGSAVPSTSPTHQLQQQPPTTNGLTQIAQAQPQQKTSSRRNPWGNLSYADLITQAIQSSADQRLTLAQIYEWLVKNIPYFSNKGDNVSSIGWKNSIRHNLSLHNRFVRMQNEGSGKSSWWTLNHDAPASKSSGSGSGNSCSGSGGSKHGGRRRANTLDTVKQLEQRRRGRGKRKDSGRPATSKEALRRTLSNNSVLGPAECFEPSSSSSLLFQSSSPEHPQERPRANSNASSLCGAAGGGGGGRLSPLPFRPRTLSNASSCCDHSPPPPHPPSQALPPLPLPPMTSLPGGYHSSQDYTPLSPWNNNSQGVGGVGVNVGAGAGGPSQHLFNFSEKLTIKDEPSTEGSSPPDDLDNLKLLDLGLGGVDLDTSSQLFMDALYETESVTSPTQQQQQQQQPNNNNGLLDPSNQISSPNAPLMPTFGNHVLIPDNNALEHQQHQLTNVMGVGGHKIKILEPREDANPVNENANNLVSSSPSSSATSSSNSSVAFDLKQTRQLPLVLRSHMELTDNNNMMLRGNNNNAQQQQQLLNQPQSQTPFYGMPQQSGNMGYVSLEQQQQQQHFLTEQDFLMLQKQDQELAEQQQKQQIQHQMMLQQQQQQQQQQLFAAPMGYPPPASFGLSTVSENVNEPVSLEDLLKTEQVTMPSQEPSQPPPPPPHSANYASFDEHDLDFGLMEGVDPVTVGGFNYAASVVPCADPADPASTASSTGTNSSTTPTLSMGSF